MDPTLGLESIEGIAALLVKAISTGNVALGVSVGIVALLSVARWVLGKASGPAWLVKLRDNPVVLWLLPTLLSVAAALVSSLVAGLPVSLGLVAKAVLVGVGANGLFNGQKKMKEVMAPKDNVEAAKAIEDSLNGNGPQP